jgi:hypothetical protein
VIEVGRRSHSGGDLISKEFLEPLRRQRGVARGVLNVAMPEIGLDCARVVAIVGELVAAGMAQHVGMRLDAQIGHGGCPLDHAEKPGADSGAPRSETKTKGEAGFRAGGGGARAFRARSEDASLGCRSWLCGCAWMRF